MAGACSMWITPGSRHLSSFGNSGCEYLETVGVFFALHLGAVETPRVADVVNVTDVSDVSDVTHVTHMAYLPALAEVA